MSQAAHIRSNTGGGMGLKPSDSWCVPLCVNCHRKQHETSEAKFWGYKIQAAKQLANKLFQASGDNIEGMRLISEWKRWI
jgi:hypothetical protein